MHTHICEDIAKKKKKHSQGEKKKESTREYLSNNKLWEGYSKTHTHRVIKSERDGERERREKPYFMNFI